MEFSSNKFFLGSQSVKRTEMEQSQPEIGEEHRISEAPLWTPQSLFKDLYNIVFIFMH